VVSLLALCALAPSRLTVGTNWGGEESLHYTSKADEIDESRRQKLFFRVTGKEDDLWVVQTQVTLLESKVGGVLMPPPPYKDPTISKAWLSPEGTLLYEDPFDHGTFELDRLIAMWLPANLPDEWTLDLSTTVEKQVTKGVAKLTSFGQPSGTSRGYRLTFTSGGDAPQMSATGVLWFDAGDGRLLSAQIEAKDALLPGSTERAHVTLAYRDSRTK